MDGKPLISQKTAKEEGLSKEAAHTLMRKCILPPGRIEYRSHVRMRMAERDFTSSWIERVIRSGCIYDAPEYSVRHGNWRYKVQARIEGYALDVVFVFDEAEDYDARPLLVPVTGLWTGEGTQNGKRVEREEKPNHRKTGYKIHRR